MTEFINDELAELSGGNIFSTPTAEIHDWVKVYGCERDALNVAIAKIQELSAWVIAQEKCPDCFGDITDVEISVDNVHRFYYECRYCGAKWLYFGKKVKDTEIAKWRATLESQSLDGVEKP